MTYRPRVALYRKLGNRCCYGNNLPPLCFSVEGYIYQYVTLGLGCDKMWKVVLILSIISSLTLLTIGWYLFETQRFTGNGYTTPYMATPSSYKMVVAIRTATRKHPTVLGVVTRLVSEPSFRDYKLLVWQSYSEAYNEEMRQTLESLGVTVFTQREVYPELSVENRIKITWGDPLNQVKWRTNHGTFWEH